MYHDELLNEDGSNHGDGWSIDNGTCTGVLVREEGRGKGEEKRAGERERWGGERCRAREPRREGRTCRDGWIINDDGCAARGWGTSRQA